MVDQLVINQKELKNLIEFKNWKKVERELKWMKAERILTTWDYFSNQIDNLSFR